MSIQSEIDRLAGIKADMKSAINGSGSTVGDVFADYPPAVSNGRAGIAAAITEKGVQTPADAPFDVLQANVRAIPSGSYGETVSISNLSSFEIYAVDFKDGYAIPVIIDASGGENSFVSKESAVIFMNSLAEPGYIEGDYESLGKVNWGFKKYNAYKVLGDCTFLDE